MTQERANPRNEQLGLFYQNATANIESGKAQQWRVVYWALLADAGLVGLRELIPSGTWVSATILTAAATGVVFAGMWLEWEYQKWITDRRKRLMRVISEFEHEVQAVWRKELKNPRYIDLCLYRMKYNKLPTKREYFIFIWIDWPYLLMFWGILIVSGGLVIWWLWLGRECDLRFGNLCFDV